MSAYAKNVQCEWYQATVCYVKDNDNEPWFCAFKLVESFKVPKMMLFVAMMPKEYTRMLNEISSVKKLTRKSHTIMDPHMLMTSVAGLNYIMDTCKHLKNIDAIRRHFSDVVVPEIKRDKDVRHIQNISEIEDSSSTIMRASNSASVIHSFPFKRGEAGNGETKVAKNIVLKKLIVDVGSANFIKLAPKIVGTTSVISSGYANWSTPAPEAHNVTGNSGKTLVVSNCQPAVQQPDSDDDENALTIVVDDDEEEEECKKFEDFACDKTEAQAPSAAESAYTIHVKETASKPIEQPPPLRPISCLSTSEQSQLDKPYAQNELKKVMTTQKIVKALVDSHNYVQSRNKKLTDYMMDDNEALHKRAHVMQNLLSDSLEEMRNMMRDLANDRAQIIAERNYTYEQIKYLTDLQRSMYVPFSAHNERSNADFLLYNQARPEHQSRVQYLLEELQMLNVKVFLKPSVD